ncbi:MAG: hypothetical protein IEMM0002_0432 [bacterium]|nr:MAG: hypothetical protein IEMM0002_0432 [bacterium]
MRHKGIFITGVGTGVGKTVAAGAIAHLLVGKGYDVGVMKPVQTGVKKKKVSACSPDLEFMRKFCSRPADPDEQSMPYVFNDALSPYHAALKAAVDIDLKKIAAAFDYLKSRHDIVIVEGAGGLMAPLTKNDSWPDLIRMLDIPIVIVTHPALGMIHETLSTGMAAEMYGLESLGMLLVETGSDDSKKHPKTDIALLEDRAQMPMLGFLPYTDAVAKKNVNCKKFRFHVEKHIDAGPIVDFIERRESSKLQKRLEKIDGNNIWHPFTQMREWETEPMLIIESGSGVMLKDVHGRKYYDGHSSYWVNVHGHCHPRLVRKLVSQAARLDHSTLLGLGNRPAIELADALLKIVPSALEKVFYSDNGSTAVEVGLKMAFQYHRQKEGKNTKRKKFAALINGYHGDTLGGVSVGGIDLYRKIFEPILADAVFVISPYCYRCPLDKSYPQCSLACAVEMEKILGEHRDEIAAFVIEPIVQCPGGIITAPHGFLRRVREVCDEYGILLITDEVAVGFGRTGRMFACEHEDVQPDIMAISKSFGAGLLPLAATLATQEIFDVFVGRYDEQKTFFHGHTFTGHPIACGVALENIRMMEESGMLASIGEKAQFMADELVRFENLQHVGDVRRVGMIAGIELVKERETKKSFAESLRTGHKVAMEARKKGLIVRPLGDILVLFPILAAQTPDLNKMVEILYDSIAAVTEGSGNKP